MAGLSSIHTRFLSSPPQATHKQADRNLARTGQSLQGALDAIGRLEGELGSASDKYVFLQKTRAYVQDLCYMLQVRVGREGTVCVWMCVCVCVFWEVRRGLLWLVGWGLGFGDARPSLDAADVWNGPLALASIGKGWL